VSTFTAAAAVVGMKMGRAVDATRAVVGSVENHPLAKSPCAVPICARDSIVKSMNQEAFVFVGGHRHRSRRRQDRPAGIAHGCSRLMADLDGEVARSGRCRGLPEHADLPLLADLPVALLLNLERASRKVGRHGHDRLRRGRERDLRVIRRLRDRIAGLVVVLGLAAHSMCAWFGSIWTSWPICSSFFSLGRFLESRDLHGSAVLRQEEAEAVVGDLEVDDARMVAAALRRDLLVDVGPKPSH
jgi:hypothetical protein